jgi:hypothetical protein
MRLKSFPLTIFLLCLPLATNAKPASDALLQSLYVKSGMQTQVGQIQPTIREGFDQAASSGRFANALNNKVVSAVRNAFVKAFVPETMQKTILEELGKRLSSDDVGAALTWLDSPLGSRITRLEEIASSANTMKDFPRFRKSLQEKPPAPARLELIARLDKAARATETGVEIAMATQLATVVALNSLLARDKPVPVLDLKHQIEKSRPQMKKMIEAQIRDFSLFTYRSLKGSELQEYLNFVESAPGRKYMSAAAAGLVKAMIDSVLNLGGAIAGELEAEKI